MWCRKTRLDGRRGTGCQQQSPGQAASKSKPPVGCVGASRRVVAWIDHLDAGRKMFLGRPLDVIGQSPLGQPPRRLRAGKLPQVNDRFARLHRRQRRHADDDTVPWCHQPILIFMNQAAIGCQRLAFEHRAARRYVHVEKSAPFGSAHLDHGALDWASAFTTNPARACGFEPASLTVGSPADLVICNARNWTELFARPQADRIVLRHGRPIDRTLPDYAELDDLWENA